ncbi:MAG TPA: hypothetical protein VH165_21060 [Kofleriaceae bacterium]|jgi:Tol biopolymer transport system component|nr:hypothetical protein [Kofleriaceae bacterium]
MVGAVAHAGCGKAVGEGAPGADAAVDGAPDNTPPPDSAVATAPRCDPSKPFGAPIQVANVNSTARDQGAILIDELTMLFGSDRNTMTNIYSSTRASLTSPFTTPVALDGLDGADVESSPSVTDDGLTLYYAHAVTGSVNAGDLYVTQRTSKTAQFPVGTPVGVVNSTSDEEDPYITPDGSALYFDSARTGTQLHLYSAVRQADGSFAPPQEMSLNTNGVVDSHPHLSHDGLTIYWSSTRTDGGAQPGTDIWMATRSSTAGEFGTATRVPELSSSSNESLSWISADGCEALLQSDRAPTLGAQDIFIALRPM